MEEAFGLYSVRTQFAQFINYTYLIIDKLYNYALIIDPAWDLREIMQILNRSNSVLKGIFLTHAHYDHVNMVSKLHELYDADVYISRIESETSGYRCQNMNLFEDMDKIQIGDIEVTCIMTPGHTKGSSCFLIEDDFFTGDTLFIEGCGVCPGYQDAKQMYNSVQRIKKLMDRKVRVYPGHSYGTEPGATIEDLFRENIYFQIEQESDFVNFRMRKEQKGWFDFK